MERLRSNTINLFTVWGHMYIPTHFAESSPTVLHDLISKYPLGILVTLGQNGLDANHIPFELDTQTGPNGTLRAHVARANAVWKDIQNGDQVLVVFRGEQAYISPNWYPSKHISHKQVPTWNYRVVHAHGKITIHDDEQYVRGVVARLSHEHEASQPIPWKMSDSPQDFISMMVKSIVGLEIEITQLVGKFKLSQNRETQDVLGAVRPLIEQGNPALGLAMLDLVNLE